jgi:hypothetical protein
MSVPRPHNHYTGENTYRLYLQETPMNLSGCRNPPVIITMNSRVPEECCTKTAVFG